MYSRIAILALALAICYAEPQHGGYGNFGGFRSGYGGYSGGYGGYSGGYGGLRGGISGGYGGYRGGYGGAVRAVAVAPVAAVAPVISKVAVAPAVAKVAVPVDHFAPPHYSYEYSVQDSHTGDIKNQHEEREGDVTRGYYSLHEPDGTVRTVHYTVDGHSGFQATVEKSGQAVHPGQVAHAVPVAHAAIPVAHAAIPVAHAAVPIAHGGYHRAY